MQSTITIDMPSGEKAMGWLHHTPARSDTCVVIIHGHNAWGRRSRFQTLANWLSHHGYDAVRWNVVRTEVAEKTFAVLPITTERAQVRALLEKIRAQYKRIVLIGHSQGGLIALSLAAEPVTQHLVDAFVQIVPVIDTRESVRDKLLSIGVSLDEFHRTGATKVTYPNNETFVYDATYFDDLLKYDAHALYKQCAKPLLMIGATGDITVPLAEVEEGFSWANEPKELFVIDDVHNFSDENAMLIAKKINEWLREKQ